MTDRSRGRRLILAAASAVATFTLAQGRTTIAALRAGASHWKYIETAGYRAIRAWFWAAANNTTATVRIWGVTKGIDSSGAEVDAHLDLLCSIALTAGNVNGVSGGLAGTSDFLCDTVALTKASESTTPKGPYDGEETAKSLGTYNDFSPANDKPGSVLLSHVGDYDGIIIELCLGDGAGAGSSPATAVNGDYQLTL